MSCRYESEYFTFVIAVSSALSASSRATGTYCQRALLVSILYTTTQIWRCCTGFEPALVSPLLPWSWRLLACFRYTNSIKIGAEVDLEPTCHSATAFPAPLKLVRYFRRSSGLLTRARVWCGRDEYEHRLNRVKRICHNYSSISRERFANFV